MYSRGGEFGFRVGEGGGGPSEETDGVRVIIGTRGFIYS